jgi:hypothetical protein
VGNSVEVDKRSYNGNPKLKLPYLEAIPELMEEVVHPHRRPSLFYVYQYCLLLADSAREVYPGIEEPKYHVTSTEGRN